MRAVVCAEYGSIEGLAIRTVPAPALKSACVRIGMKVASINPPDVLMAQGRYHIKPSVPFIAGIEGAGVVLEVAADAPNFRAGDRVMTYAGLGCFADEVVVPATRVFRIPDGMDDESASGFVVAYGTAHHALVKSAALTKGETLVVLGAAGGIGLASIQLGKALGARAIAVASTAEKLQKCKEHGADELVRSDESLREQIKKLTNNVGADVILDLVGGDATDSALRGIAPYGRYLVAGYASGIVPNIKANLILLKQARVIGASFRILLERSPESAAENVRDLCNLWQRKSLRPEVTARYRFEDVVPALKRTADRQSIGKTALCVS